MAGWSVRYLVDGMNVIGSRPDGWWRDRPGARRALVEALGALVPEDEVTVFFDGSPTPGEADDAAARGVTARFAPGGPNAADDAIVTAVGQTEDPGSLVVVTSDAALARRASANGARVVGVGAFRRQLDGAGR